MQAECKKCGHVWEETGEGGYYACPECGTMYARAALPHPHAEEPEDDGSDARAEAGAEEIPDEVGPEAPGSEGPPAPPPRERRPPVALLRRDEDERPRIPARWLAAVAAVLAAAAGGWLVWSWVFKHPGWELNDEPPRYGVPGIEEILAADYLELKQRAGWGDAQAQYAMGVRWAYGEDHVHARDVEGMARADIEAQSREYFVAAAMQGYPPAQTVMAVEDGYPGLSRRDPIEEPRRMRDAAGKDYPPAWYVSGLWAVHASPRQEDPADQSLMRHDGLLAIERAALAGYAPAEHWTAIAHWCGLHGFDRDEEAAATWMARAATDGSPLARRQVVELYAERVAEPSPVEARAWALLGGDDAGATSVELTDIQVRHAELRAGELRDQARAEVDPIPTPGHVPWPRIEDLDCGAARRPAPPAPTAGTSIRTTGELASRSTVEQRRIARDTTCDETCVTAWIGPDGGEVALTDGTTVVYAPGEVSQLMEVTLEPVSPIPWGNPGEASPLGTAVRVHQLTDENPRGSLRVPAPGDLRHPRARDFVMVHGALVPTGGMTDDGKLWDGVRFEGTARRAYQLTDGLVVFSAVKLPSRAIQAFHSSDPTRVIAVNGEESGYITVNCKPWCRVDLDGKYIRNSPIKQYAVAPGPHRLELACGTCRSAPIIVQSFNVEAGETYTSVRNHFVD